MPEIIYWENNICGNCGFQSTTGDLQKLVCSGEQEGLECCPICGFLPDSPDEMHRTVDFIQNKLRSGILG